MTQTNNPFLDQMAAAMTNAAGFADGLYKEVQSFVKIQMEKWMNDMNLVRREEFDAVRDMAVLARQENEALKTRLDALEKKQGS